jgi:lipopolysaccharide export system permease protein
MSWTLIRSVAREYVVLLLGILSALVLVFLVGDFVDRAKAYTGPDWISAVAELYLNKALVSLHQLAPAALLLAAGATISSLRKRGELTALQSLGFSPRVLLLPIGGLALLACLSLVIFEEKVVVNASRRVEEITVHRFNRWGDWRFYYVPKQWFRRGEHVFHLRGGDVEQGFENATILTMDHDFRLRRRIDARHMRSAGGSRWTMQDVMERTFHVHGTVTLRQPVEAEYDLGAAADAFRIQMGRPEQMPLAEIRRQIEARGEVGLETRNFELAVHNRVAYPLAGLPAALLAVLLAIRAGRRGHLTAALVEGLCIAMAMWSLMVVSRTLVLAERMPPALAAWLPFLLLSVSALVAWARYQGLFARMRSDTSEAVAPGVS